MPSVGFVWNNQATFPHFQQNFQHSFVQGADFFVFFAQKNWRLSWKMSCAPTFVGAHEGEKFTSNRGFRKILMRSFYRKNLPRETRKNSFAVRNVEVFVRHIAEKIAPTLGSLAVRTAGAKWVRDCLEIAEKQAKISSAAQRKKRTNKGSLREGSLPAFDNDVKK